tara:strand:+ start:12514 stop:13020 length:507 start_codon:yes stop_codon:yes gene_type:complete
LANINIQTLNNDLYIYKDRVSIKSDYAFQGILIDYNESKPSGSRPSFSSLLPNNYIVRSGLNKILILKLNHQNENQYVGTETDLFTKQDDFYITNAVLVRQDLGKSNLAINYSSIETWDNLDMTWETLTRKWEDISYDGKSKIPKWHRVNSFDKELNKVTQKKELRNK